MPTVLRTILLRNQYVDSVTLMRASAEARGWPEVEDAAALMASPANLASLEHAGLLDRAGVPDSVAATDLVVSVRADDEAADAAVQRLLGLLRQEHQPAVAGTTGGLDSRPRTLDQALGVLPDASVALISVPGPYAAAEALRALRRGLHVFLFSSNVPVADEVRLKEEAARRGLLVMGPDCGTALVAGVGLGFANRVARGPVGIVAASGTGLQEVACLLDRLGSGVSHALGTGGRDLSDEVGGRTALAAIEALSADPATGVLLLITKPPSPRVARRVLDALGASERPAVACLLGLEDELDGGPVRLERTLRDAAYAAAHAGGATEPPSDPPPAPSPRRGWVRGLYSGGTLAYEALAIARAERAAVSYDVVVADDGAAAWPAAHAFVDLGAERYTDGRPHPMIDPRLRLAAITQAAGDPSTSVLLLDVVLGYGASADPAADLAPAVRAALAARPDLLVAASVCGTDADPQVRSRQVEHLEAAGARVWPSNADAVQAALAAAGGEQI